MSWAARRQFSYISGIILFFAVIIGVPILYEISKIPSSCQPPFTADQGPGSVAGGPCLILDDSYLEPHAILWARSFHVRDGSYNAVAYIQNPNPNAGVVSAGYQFSLYDSENVLVAQKT